VMLIGTEAETRLHKNMTHVTRAITEHARAYILLRLSFFQQ